MLSGCAALPKLPYSSRPDVKDVVKSIRCQVKRVFDDNISTYPWIQYWAAGVDLTLRIKRDTGAAGAIALAIPLTPGTLTLKANAGLSEIADKKANLSFVHSLAEASRFPCDGVKIALAKGSYLLGDLGFSKWVDTTGRAFKDDNFKDNNFNDTVEPLKFSLTVEFVVVADGGIDPTFSMIPLGNNTLTANLKLTNKLTATHTIVLQFTRLKTAPSRKFVARLIRNNGQIIVTSRIKPPAVDEEKLFDKKETRQKTQKRIITYPTPKPLDEDTKERSEQEKLQTILRNLTINE